MPIEFACPSCQKMLRVPDESAGARAKCPQCGNIAEVPRPGIGEVGSPPSPPDDASPFGGAPQPDANPFGDAPKPDDNPFGGSASSFQTQSDPFSTNPYASPTAPKPIGAGASSPFSNQIVATRIEIGNIMGYAWEAWKNNIGLLVGITVTVAGINFGLSALQGALRAMLEQQGEREIAMAIAVGFQIVGNIIQMFLGIGMVQIILRILRRQPAEFSQLFGGGPLFLRLFGASIIAGLVFILGLAALIIPGIILALFFWPYYYFIVDDKAGAMESFGMAKPVGQANIMTTIIMVVVSIGLTILGLLALCIGTIFTQPLIAMIWGTAYLMMSGQLRADAQYA